MSEENVDALPLTSVELLDAAVWREILKKPGLCQLSLL